MSDSFCSKETYGKLLRKNKRLARDLSNIERVMDAVNTAILVVGASGWIQFANKYAAKILGLNEDRTMSIFKLLPGIDEAIIAVSDTGVHVVREFETNYPEYRMLSAQIVPYLDDESCETFAIILNDVTKDRQHAEERIESEKIASVLNLASGVAHELGNPLNSINIHLQLVRRKLSKLSGECTAGADGKLIDGINEAVGICASEVARLDGIIENFLKALRPMRPNMSDCDILKPLAETLKILNVELGNLGISVHVKAEKMLPKVYADENLLKQLYFNILRNSMEAMDGGGDISIDAREEDDYVRVSFKDTGCGIDADGIANLFQPYFTTKPDGHGLGMTIIHAIVRAHNGKIDVESKPGEGTKISICIPRAEKRVKMLT